MKKTLLFVIATILVVTSCTKEKSASPESKMPAKNLLNVVNPGSGGTIAYNATTGKYVANWFGANLEFAPIPTNTNFKDGDPVDLTISCTNCSHFTNASIGYFVGAIPLISPSAISKIASKVSEFNEKFKDHIEDKRNTDGTVKVPVMPSFPESGGEWEQAFSGVVVRTHSTQSTIGIMPSTFKVNPPIIGSNEGSLDIGGIISNNIYYSITINAITKRITNVYSLNLATNELIADLPASGVATNASNTRVTLRVVLDGNVLLDVVDQLVQ